VSSAEREKTRLCCNWAFVRAWTLASSGARLGCMSDKKIQTFEEFWPFYVGEHSRKATRLFHFVGSTMGASLGLAAVALRRPSLLGLGLVCGYGPAWVSHFFIEKNKPASFKYPLWSFAADWVMWTKIIEGTMDAEVERVMASKDVSPDEPVSSQVSTQEASTYAHHPGANGVS